MSASQSQPGTATADAATSGAEPSAAFTPGPWAVVSPCDDFDNISICAFDGDPADGIMADVVAEITSIEDEADARLISAAPDQHEALRHQRTLTARVMKALMATGRRDDLLLADEVHRADAANREALAKALGLSTADTSDRQSIPGRHSSES